MPRGNVSKRLDSWRAAELARESESLPRQRSPLLQRTVELLSVFLALFLLYTAGFGEYTAFVQRGFPLLLISLIIFLSYPSPGAWHWLDLAGMAATAFSVGYILVFYQDIGGRMGLENNLDRTAAAIGTLVAIEIARRTAGNTLPLVAGLFLLYDLFGDKLPGMFGHPPLSFLRVVRYTWLNQEGIFGAPLGVMASFIFLYILFGTILKQTGAGEVFTDLAFGATGRLRSGPAQAAVVSSAFFGTISGSAAANVVGTGTFTIPLMKKMGYQPAFAGAVEAAASTGGQLMPPIMGASAFIMAETLGIPYAQVVKVAIVPAVLYYIGVAAAVHLEALRLGLRGLAAHELPRVGQTLLRGVPYFIPVGILVAMLFLGYSTSKAGFYAILAMLVASLHRPNNRKNFLSIVWRSLVESVAASAQIWAAVAVIGIVMGSVTMTGLGPRLAELVSQVAGTSPLGALFVTMLASMVLGMGLPTVACYLLVAVLVAPAIVSLGVPVVAAHLFSLYFGVMAVITPPVAIAAYAAAGIAQTDPWRVGWQAVRLALPAFLVPYIFAFAPELLLMGTPLNTVRVLITTVIGVIVLAVATIGYLGGPLSIPYRVGYFGVAFLLIHQGLETDLAGLLLLAAVASVQRWQSRRQRPASG